MKKETVLDIELYPNYFLVKFYFPETETFVEFTNRNMDRLAIRKIIQSHTVYTFNGNGYDIPIMIMLLLEESVTIGTLFRIGGQLISGTVRPWEITNKYSKESIAAIGFDHVDLIEVAFGKSSLKTYAGRIYAPYMQDLPYDPYTVLTDEQKQEVADYCGNDCRNTWLLKLSLQEALDLRVELGKKYACDLRSRSDAQIAEEVISRELFWKHQILARVKRYSEDFSFTYDPPEYISFNHDNTKKIFEMLKTHEFTLFNGKVALPKHIKDTQIKIGNTVYQLGNGGLHSTESRQTVFSDDEYMLVDRDVASYYPNIILQNKLYPPHIGEAFLSVYKGIVDARLKAKREGDKITANTLKITINGSFGKFGSEYSFLFAPKLLIQTTVTGQLALLMLIEWLTDAGFEVVSGNTDGIVTKIARTRKDEFDSIIAQWEKVTGFETEETEYKALYSRDVNSYIAVKPDGTAKRKGAFKPSIEGKDRYNLDKNPAGQIISDAVEKFLIDGTDVAETINNCNDIRKFLYVRKVEGGCIDSNGNKIGKVIRWYYGKNVFTNLKYARNNAKVPLTDGAVPLMYLDGTFPKDIDYNFYIMEAKKILNKNFDKPVQYDFLADIISDQ